MPENAKDAISLHKQMSVDADTTLVFDGHNMEVTVHATILRLHSPVLAQNLELTPSSSCCKRKKSSSQSSHATSSAGLKRLRMTGTSKDDFLTVARFMYPVVPLPKVSWHNLEVLLVQGRKWNMPVVLAQAAAFIRTNASSMGLKPNSSKYVFRWLQLAHAANLTDACEACVDRNVALGVDACTKKQLESLSKKTLVCIVQRMGRGSNKVKFEKGKRSST